MAGRLDALEPYLPPAVLRGLRKWRRRMQGAEAATPTATFDVRDLDELRDLFLQTGAAPSSGWDRVRHANMPLPDWFDAGLDPWSREYRAQQERLWQIIVGVDRPYDPSLDECDVYGGTVDAIRQPAFYMRRDASAIHSASDHVLAMGMIMRHSGVRAGEHALEYGAGFGQTALSLARMGVTVDTVDVSKNFCRWVQEQADFFRVRLRAHHGRFGHNPRPGFRYRLIWFYESFHHCWDFDEVVPRLRDMLAPGGRVVLGGEPVFEAENAAVPYPWGVRLHSEVAAIMRHTRWMELGFSESFLFELFERHGFTGRRVDCEPTLFGRLYVFEAPPLGGPGPVAQRWEAAGGALQTVVGRLEHGALVTQHGQPGALCYGPYVRVEPGSWWARIELAPTAPCSGMVFVDVVSEGGVIHASQWFELGASGTLDLPFGLGEAVTQLEIRVAVDPGSSAAVAAVALHKA